MAELKCSVASCCHHKGDCCCKGDIMIGGKDVCCSDDTCCESFAKRKADSYVSVMEHPCKLISIDCEATQCTYNKSYKCNAKQVNINGCGACNCKETCCETFQAKAN